MHNVIRYRAWADSCWAQHKDDRVPIGFMISMFPLISQIYGMKAKRQNAVGATRQFLNIVRRSLCGNPRDKVFALFGIFPMDLTPDYAVPVAGVYGTWASGQYQDFPLGSLIFYSGIGLYPSALEMHNLASW